MHPASILRAHPNATVYLDTGSASLLGTELQKIIRDQAQVTISG